MKSERDELVLGRINNTFSYELAITDRWLKRIVKCSVAVFFLGSSVFTSLLSKRKLLFKLLGYKMTNV